MPRHHCFVSASSVTGARRWRWQAETASGIALRASGCDFSSFDECAKHAFAHGYSHIEVPVLGSFTAPLHAATAPVRTEPPVVTERDHEGGELDLHEDKAEDMADVQLLSDASAAMLSGPVTGACCVRRQTA